MADVITLHDGVIQQLATIPNLIVIDSDIVTQPATDPTKRFIKPYAIVWSDPGDSTIGASLSQVGTTGLIWRVTVICVGANRQTCQQVVGMVRGALLGSMPGGGSPLVEQPTGQMIQPEKGVTPARFFVPLQFVCTAA